jgi:hypothetical protein
MLDLGMAGMLGLKRAGASAHMPALSSWLQQLRQLCNVRRDPPRLVHGHLPRTRALRGVVTVGVSNREAVGIDPLPAARCAGDAPGRRESGGACDATALSCPRLACLPLETIRFIGLDRCADIGPVFASIELVTFVEGAEPRRPTGHPKIPTAYAAFVLYQVRPFLIWIWWDTWLCRIGPTSLIGHRPPPVCGARSIRIQLYPCQAWRVRMADPRRSGSGNLATFAAICRA